RELPFLDGEPSLDDFGDAIQVIRRLRQDRVGCHGCQQCDSEHRIKHEDAHARLWPEPGCIHPNLRYRVVCWHPTSSHLKVGRLQHKADPISSPVAGSGARGTFSGWVGLTACNSASTAVAYYVSARSA